MRVGENSPSLWPTMFSVISTGMCCLPLCTAIVRPTISGVTIERRDQVLIGLRSFLAAAVSTFFERCRSTNGPFFSERGTAYFLRCTIMFEVRLFLRVLKPLVFQPHG